VSHTERIERFFSRVGTFCAIVGATVVIAVLGNYVLAGLEVVHTLVTAGSVTKVDARQASPVYGDDPDRVAYWTEFNKVWSMHFEPYYHWRRNPFHGRFINVDANGVRLTPTAQPKPGVRKLFMFGGSTLWGTGAADKDTIPSYVQAALGAGYDVRNYGESAWVSTQELNYLLYQLARGNVPDVVVFYDGVNDGYAGAYSPGVPRDPHNLREQNAADKSLLLDLFHRTKYDRLLGFLERSLNRVTAGPGAAGGASADWDKKMAAQIDRNGRGVVEMYEAHIKQVKALAREYGFKAYFFWQPNLFSLTRKNLNAYEKAMIDEASPVLVASQKKVYEIARQKFANREAENIFFIGNLFDAPKEPIYIDWHHVGANGNRIIADAMLARLGKAP